MANKCSICGKFTAADGAKCSSCGLLFHRHCANVKPNADGRLPARWHCKGCKNKITKNNTPESCSSGSTETDNSEGFQNCSESAGGVNIAAEIKIIREQLTSIVQDTSNCRQEMSAFKQEIIKLNSCFTEFNRRLNTVEEKLNNVSKRLSVAEGKIEAGIGGIGLTAEIERHLNDRDQEAFITDIEISGIEEQANENLVHLVTVISQKIGVSVEEREIINVERRGKRQIDEAGVTRRPRTLVVRLSRRALRDQLIRAARVRRAADTEGILSTAQPRRFYINERLTWLNRRLFRIAREEARSKGWRYVWTRDGRIYARRNTDSPALRIRSESDIEKFNINTNK